ncbi:MAG: magnesium transporter [Bradymonadia bacterium]
MQKLLRRGADAHVERVLGKSRPADVAAVMRFLDERQQQKIFSHLPDDECRAEVVSELDPHLQVQLLSDAPIDTLKAIVEQMSDDDRTDLISELPESLQAQLLEALAPAEAEELELLLNYPADTAGGIMSTEFFSLLEDTTAEQAVRALQTAGDDVDMAFYVYVLNEHDHLVGVVSLRALVTHPAQTPLSDLMQSDVISATLTTDQEEVARLAARYNLLAVPVVDEANKLVGIVTIDDVIDVIREEATEDILKMAGADESAYEGGEGSVLRNVRRRAPWLFATWLGGLGASLLIGLFEHQLDAQVALAAFIPVVLGMGGNVGIQTATIIVRGIATGKVNTGVGLAYLSREGGIGLILGLLFGCMLAIFALVRYHGEPGTYALAATVGVSICASMLVSATVGAVIPLALERVRIDPAVATGPLVTTMVDLLAILAYFMVAAVLAPTG